MANPAALPSLSPREAIIDSLYRLADGMDGDNSELFKSALVQSEETFFEVIGANKIDGADGIYQHLFEGFSKITTTHHISNVRVNWKDGADTAYLTARALGYHYVKEEAMMPDSKPLKTGGLYYINVEKDGSDGLWKIKNFTVKLNWIDGDMAMIRGQR